MLLKLPGYLKQSGRQGELRVDGVVPVDAAPRGGFGAEGKDGKLKGGLQFPPVLYVAMQARAARGSQGVACRSLAGIDCSVAARASGTCTANPCFSCRACRDALALPSIPFLLQGGGAHARAPGQIEFLRSNGVPADLLTVRPRWGVK